MMSSTERAPAQRTPAWAKFLKLKQPAGAAASAPGAGPNGSNVGHQPSGRNGGAAGALPSPSTKRGAPFADASPPKRARRETPQDGRNVSSNKPTKTVTFGDTPTKASSTSSKSGTPLSRAASSKRPAKTLQQQPKKPKGPPKKQKPQAVADLGSALAYLRQWQNSRDTWKFNKNHQSTLIKRFFDADGIPSSDTKALYAYISDLKGFVRTRLLETAMEIQTQDIADGPAAFPDGTAHREDKQATYESIITELLRRGREQQQAKRKIAFDEAEYVAASEDVDVIIRRVVKRMRAELVIHELSDSEESTNQTSNANTPSQTAAASDDSDEDDEDDDDDDGNDENGNGQPSAPKVIPGKRRRKLRTNMDDSSSSESESESESGTSSSSSSDDSDSDDDDEAEGPPPADYETSSSSSSSGEEDDDSDEEDSGDE